VRHQRRRQAAAGRAALLLPHLGRPPRLARFPHPPRRRRRRRRSRTTTEANPPELADAGEEFGQNVFFLSFCFGRLCYVRTSQSAHFDYLRASTSREQRHKWAPAF
jgi:hypothetical protein